MLLPDVNVWLALTFDSHIHHPSAKTWFDGLHQSFSPHVWNDAYLAAFALAAKLELVTFDKGFAQYQNVSCTILT